MTTRPSPRNTSSRSTRHRTSWGSSRRRASLQRLQLRPRTPGCASFGRAARPPRSHRRRPGRQVLLLDLQCDLSGFLTICLIVDRWRQFLSVLKFVVLQSPRTGPPSGVRRSARRDGTTSDANRSGLACCFLLMKIPGHALHEKGLQRQKGVGPLASSQEQRALLVPQLNRLSTADRPRVNHSFRSPICLHRISCVRASGETLKQRFFDPLENTKNLCFLGEQFCWHPILPDLARPPRRAPRPDPPVVCPSFSRTYLA